MRHQISNKKYKETIGLISHLILTRPDAVRKLLKRHGVVFSPAPTRGQLIAYVVELLAENNPSFNQSLSKLLTVHIKYKGRDMFALEGKKGSQRSYYTEDEFLGGLIGGVAKNLIGGLFKKKNKSSSSATPTASQAAEIEKMKADMQRQMLEMEKQRQEQEQERRKSREEEQRRRREEEARQKRQMYFFGGGAVVVTVVVIVLAISLRPKK